jgi:hypothetical protein
MRTLALPALVAGAVTLFLFGCGKEQSAPAAPAPAAAKAPSVAEKIPPYTYPAPVKGHLTLEVSSGGSFDPVDGIAYTAAVGGGTVVYVVSKPIASPVLAGSACPLAQAQALAKLRNADFAEVTLDAAGRSKYFAAGTPFAGSMGDLTPGAWSSKLTLGGARAMGSVVHRKVGQFAFDLPVLTPQFDQISWRDTDTGRKVSPTTPKPSEQQLTAAYEALHEAAAKKDLKAMLAALGFDAKQSLAIRGLDGIDADFALFADRFLNPGKPDDAINRPGAGQVRAEGTKASGKNYVDDYYFDLCGDKLILTHIVEQPWH